MQSLSLALVVLATVVGSAVGDDDCAPTPGQKHVHANECCKFNDFVPSALKTAADKCMQKYPMGPPPSGPPPTGPPPTPSAEMKRTHACTGECVFAETGLLTTDKQLDKAAISKLFTTSDADLAPVVAAAVDKCFSSYPADIDTSLECKSGANEFQQCIMKQIFLNCPASLWSASAECEAFQSKVAKCPNMPFMMGGPRGPKH